MATGLHDVRPRLLALVRWHEWSEMDACIAYGRRYLGTCKPQIDPGAIEYTRRNWPFLRDRRIDAYGPILNRYIG